MPPFWSTTTSKAVGSLLSRGNGYSSARKFNRIRRLSSIAGIETPSVQKSRVLANPFHEQRRRFLGCGDGEEGGVLSKVYEEKRVLGYSPEQLFDVVAAVDLYHGFVPWCQRSEKIQTYADGSFDAELEIGFKFLVESYVSHVELERPKRIKVASVFFKEVVSKLVGSFNDRCRLIYGPGVRVLENSYGQSA
ncbi:uncharacterized protein LOC133737010 isoform X2 [Rosa rugosa]|uniref:uncharacterized protein LOC133737010 isoform X2 n=1 Tax=Rosa rugosa TaxID=74645 RepID=UPI002B417EDC|nr:uncharacterized protein LOC133737010 isoform X2 [Rosa rugosa]